MRVKDLKGFKDCHYNLTLLHELEVPELTEADLTKVVEDWEFDYDIPLQEDEIVFLIEAILKATEEKRRNQDVRL